MRIVVLGGAGQRGEETIYDLCRFSKAREIIIADRDRQAAEVVASKARDPRVKVKVVDPDSKKDLLAVMQGYPVVASALGPSYRFEQQVIEAALLAGVNYVSLCDDHDVCASVLAFDQIARQRGRRILVGLGWAPGLSNMLARKGFEELEEVDEINVYRATSASDLKERAMIMQTLHSFAGTAAQFSEGRHVGIKAGTEREMVGFPTPIDELRLYHLGHPEPITLPRYLKGVKNVTFKGGLAENYLSGLARFSAALRLSNSNFGKQVAGTVLKGMINVLPKDKKRQASGIRVDIHGWRGGRPVSISYAATGRMGRLAGVCLSVGAMMMAENKIRRFGVFGPEAESAVDTASFLEELARREIIIGRRELEQELEQAQSS